MKSDKKMDLFEAIYFISFFSKCCVISLCLERSEFYEISPNSTLNPGDDVVSSADLPLAFPFLGSFRDQLYVSI